MMKIILCGMGYVFLSTMYGCASMPGSVTIHRSAADLSLSCEKEGALPGVASVKSSTKAMAFGNILFGGVIGAGVDIATGSAFDYPPLVQVEMGSVTVIAPLPPAGSATAPSAAAVALVKSNAQAPGQSGQPSESKLQPLESPQSYPYTLSGLEVTTHFQRYQELEMEQATVPFTLKIHADGRVERDCASCNVHYGTGTMEIKQTESLVCFNWSVVTYPASGCYQVL